MLEAFAVSAGAVAVSEIGDKTQLLALLLAARFRRPWPIVAGIFVATLANHAAAAALGAWLQSLFDATSLRWLLGASFLAVAAWMLVPDRADADAANARATHGLGIFGITLIAFFLAEMGDKTQIATVALAARYHAFAAVVAGTTLGMMIANVPAVLVGGRLAHRLPIRLVHAIAAAIFATLGVIALTGIGA
jgi:putative Ca2+/H+ antiporter (TMEM165/GDT1 family)